MELKENHLRINKTARYLTVGRLSPATRRIWFVLHGYGQSVHGFIKKFNVFDPQEDFVVAPEGLSRFYWNGFGGKPVASWMTSEDRAHEIKDYVDYLDRLYLHIMDKVADTAVAVHLLGFSQGTATASRWAAAGQAIFQQQIFWAGGLAHDIEWRKALSRFQESKLYFVLGNRDEYISIEEAQKQLNLVAQLGLEFDFIEFTGKHEIHAPTLKTLAQKINDGKAD